MKRIRLYATIIIFAAYLVSCDSQPQPDHTYTLAAGSELTVICEGQDLTYEGSNKQVFLFCNGQLPNEEPTATPPAYALESLEPVAYLPVIAGGEIWYEFPQPPIE